MTTATATPVKVRVSALVKGDKMVGTGETVAWSYRGVKTPKGEHEVRLVREDGAHRDARWNMGSMVWVIR